VFLEKSEHNFKIFSLSKVIAKIFGAKLRFLQWQNFKNKLN
jgi:hypothetical protein